MNRTLLYLIIPLTLVISFSTAFNGCADLESDEEDPCANGACELECEPGYEERLGECVVNVD